MNAPTLDAADVDPTDDDALAAVAEDLPGTFDFEQGGWFHALTDADPDADDDRAGIEDVLFVGTDALSDDMVLTVHPNGEATVLAETTAPREFWESDQKCREVANRLGAKDDDELKDALLAAFTALKRGLRACDAPFWRVWRSPTADDLAARIRSVDFYPQGDDDSEFRVRVAAPDAYPQLGTQTLSFTPWEVLNGPPEVFAKALAGAFSEAPDLTADDWEHLRNVIEHLKVVHGDEGNAEEDAAVEALVGKLSTTRVTDDPDEIHPRNDDTLLFERDRAVPPESPIDADVIDVVWMLGEPFVEWRREQGHDQQCTRRVLEERGLKVGPTDQKVLTTTDGDEHRRSMWPIRASAVGITREDAEADGGTPATDGGEAFPR